MQNLVKTKKCRILHSMKSRLILLKLSFIWLIIMTSMNGFGQDSIPYDVDSNQNDEDSIMSSQDIYVARAVVIEGDTLWVAELDEVYIFPTKKF